MYRTTIRLIWVWNLVLALTEVHSLSLWCFVFENRVARETFEYDRDELMLGMEKTAELHGLCSWRNVSLGTKTSKVLEIHINIIEVKIEASWNVMAHAQKPDFDFRRNGTSPFNSAWGRQFSLLLAAEVCASAVVMLDTPCSEVVWRVLATHCIRQFPLDFPSRASPCAITFQLESTCNEHLLNYFNLKFTMCEFKIKIMALKGKNGSKTEFHRNGLLATLGSSFQEGQN